MAADTAVAAFLKEQVKPHVHALRRGVLALQDEHATATRQVTSLQSLLDNEKTKVRRESQQRGKRVTSYLIDDPARARKRSIEDPQRPASEQHDD